MRILADNVEILGQMEILTNNGWIKVEDITGKNVLACMTDNKITWEQPLTVIKEKERLIRCCKMVSQTSDEKAIANIPFGFRFLCTDRIHGQVYNDLVAAERLNLGQSRKIKCSGLLYNLASTKHLTCLEKLHIMTQADGRVYQSSTTNSNTVTLGFTRERKIERCGEIVDACKEMYQDLAVTENDADNYTFSIKTSIPVFKRFKDWVDFSTKSQSWISEFISEVIEWDGSKTDYGFSYSNTDLDAVDTVQIAALLSGYTSTRTMKVGTGNNLDLYTVNVNTQKLSTRKGYSISTKHLVRDCTCRIVPRNENSCWVFRSNYVIFLGK